METKSNPARWFTGKALATYLSYVVPTLAEAEALGYWPKGASRKIHAALNKQSVAKKLGNGVYKYADGPTVFLAIDVGAGFVTRATHVLVECDRLLATPECSYRAELREFRAWAADWAPTAELLALLDSRRPAPVVVCGTLSPTVVAHLGKSLGIALETVYCPPVRRTWVTKVVKGTPTQVAVDKILWPEGTRHGTSWFAGGTAYNHQCHACGHAIKNPFNWVPLVGTSPAGPLSLWVGRDCATKLFGCTVSGKGTYE